MSLSHAYQGYATLFPQPPNLFNVQQSGVSQPPPSVTTTMATASIVTWLWQWWGHRRAHEGAVAGAREVTHLEPLGTFFFCFIFFYYTNELSRLCPTLAPPWHITTWKCASHQTHHQPKTAQTVLTFIQGIETHKFFSFFYLFFFYTNVNF